MPKKATKAEGTTPKAPKKAVSAIIIGDNGATVRTYTKKEHGADYLILAEQFASKKGYTVTYK